MSWLNRLLGMFICLTLVSPALAWCHPASDGEASNVVTTARSEIWKEITSGHSGSATVAILDDGKVVYAEGFGVADREKNVPVDRNTLFNIGSISKTYCATAIMLLVDAGKVELDKPVVTYLPEFVMDDPRYKEITVRMLLNHSSGLPGTNYVNSFGFAYNEDFYQETLAMLAQSRLKHRPGEMAIYCNDGFTLAEMIVTKVSGKSYRQFLEERIFKPLALDQTDLAVGQRPPTELAMARYYNAQGVREPLEALSFLASGGLSTTATELCRFVDSFSDAGKHILSPDSLAEMKKVQPSAFWGKLRNPQISYGLGWDMTDIPLYSKNGIQVLGKSGGTGHYNSMVYTLPDKRIAVAVIIAGHSSAQEVAQKILDAYLMEKGWITKEPVAVKAPVKAQPLPPAYMEYAGFYAGDAGALYKVSLDVQKGILTTYNLENGQEKLDFTAEYADSYFHTAKGNKFYFATVEGSRYFVLADPQMDFVLWQKIEPIAPDKQQRLAVEVDGQQWLRRNAKAYDGIMFVPTHLITSHLINGLTGYVELMGVKPVMAPTYAGLPGKAVRDGTEIKLVGPRSASWIWLSGGVYMNAREAVEAKVGNNSISLGMQGYNEWLKTTEDAVLSFEKPGKGRIIVFSPTGTSMYDSEVNQGDIFAPAGSWVEMLGNQGDVFRVGVLATK